MSSSRLVLLASLAAVTLTGCVTSYEGRSIEEPVSIGEVCVIRNDAVRPGYVLPSIQRAFAKRNIATKVCTESTANGCQFILRYTARQSWDFTPYLKSARLDLYQGARLIANSELYVYPYNLSKWSGEEERIEKLVDDLFEKAAAR